MAYSAGLLPNLLQFFQRLPNKNLPTVQAPRQSLVETVPVSASIRTRHHNLYPGRTRMATTSSQAAGSMPSRSNSFGAPKRTATDQKTCWICMESASDNPTAEWSNPCHCSLEAHEACLLRWIAEMEQSSGRTKNGVQCPQCKAPITIEEPYDAVVQLRDRFHRAYSKVSPLMLLLLLSSGTAAGSAWYGLMATNVFAGSFATAKWLTSNGELLRRRTVPLLRWKPFWVFNIRLWILSLVGPTITIIRAFPPLGSLVFLPASLLYGGSLFLRDNIPTWPPSPEWAMTLMPIVHMTYQNLYYEFFGRLEKRLNRALRGRPENEDPQAQRQQAAIAGAGAGAVVDGGGNGGAAVEGAMPQEQDEDPGLLANLFALGRAIMGLFGDGNDDEIEIAVHIHANGNGLPEDNDAEDDGEQVGDGEAGAHEVIQADAEVLLEGPGAENGPAEDELIDILDAAQGIAAAEEPEEPIPVAPAAPQQGNGEEEQPVRPQGEAEPVPEPERQAEPDQPLNRARPRRDRRGLQRRQRRERRQERNANRNGGQNDAAPAAEDRGSSALTEIVNSLVTSLMFPVVSYGMGELLRTTVPKAWVASPGSRPPTGLLQQRWGRSLVGGCLFVVLKDTFTLYIKYRRVQVKRNRRVRSVKKD